MHKTLRDQSNRPNYNPLFNVDSFWIECQDVLQKIYLNSKQIKHNIDSTYRIELKHMKMWY